jgi:N-acetylneuraminate synthase
VVEVHLTFSRECFGPDVESSLTTEQLRQLVEGVRFLETAMANPVDKDQVCRELQDVRRLFTKSIVAEADLPAGTVLNDWHVGLRKPGTGLPADLLGRVVGQRLARAVTRGQFLAEEDFASPVMRELQGQS